MNKLRKFIEIVNIGKVILLLIPIILIAASCNKPNPEQKVIDEAIIEFENTSYNKRWEESPENIKLLIQAIAGGEGWEILSEDINYEKTKHFDFPLTANRLLILSNQNNPGELIGQEQLFIYGFERGEWFPISVKKSMFKNKEITDEKKENLWSMNNDWHEIFKEDSDDFSDIPTPEELAQ